jgi:hypothetical protein
MLLQARPCGAGQVGDRTGGAQEPSGVGAWVLHDELAISPRNGAGPTNLGREYQGGGVCRALGRKV